MKMTFNTLSPLLKTKYILVKKNKKASEDHLEVYKAVEIWNSFLNQRLKLLVILNVILTIRKIKDYLEMEKYLKENHNSIYLLDRVSHTNVEKNNFIENSQNMLSVKHLKAAFK